MKEAFWTVSFKVNAQNFGHGVIVSKDGKIFGGDSAFTYSGNYKTENQVITAVLNISRYAQGLPNVMGMDNYTLHVQGVDGTNQLLLEGHPSGQPQARLQIVCNLKESF